MSVKSQVFEIVERLNASKSKFIEISNNSRRFLRDFPLISFELSKYNINTTTVLSENGGVTLKISR